METTIPEVSKKGKNRVKAYTNKTRKYIQEYGVTTLLYKAINDFNLYSIIMRQQRSKDCFHKIICFQRHPNCQEVAAICQKKCQVSHKTNNSSTFVSVEAVHLQFSKIRSKLIEALKIYSDKFTKEYEQLMKAFQKKYTDSLMAMERQMLNMIIKHANMNKDFLDKIENERL